jgi:hypothetical protein
MPSDFSARFSGPFCSQVIDRFVELAEVGIVGIVIAATPPFGEFGMSLVRRIGKRLAELPIPPWAADVLGRAVSCGFKEHRALRADCREGALDLDAVRPAVAKVVKVFERFGAGILDCGQQRDFACIDETIPPFLVRQTKTNVTDAEFVKVAVGPAHRRLQHLVQPIELDAERHDNTPHHRRFDVVEGNLQADYGTRHLQAANI